MQGWIYLLVAAVFEVGWPFGLKMAASSTHKPAWIAFAVVAMAASGVFLYFAQKTIPVGTAYAVWTGIGAACTFALGVAVFHDPLNLLRVFGAFLIVAGVVLLKVAH